MVVLSIGLFFGMLICFEVGIRTGRRTAGGEVGESGMSVIEAAIVGLLGLLLAFVLFSAMTRYDTRRQLAIDEANAIGIAYLRVDLLPTGQAEVRRLFRDYLEARIDVYAHVSAAERQRRIIKAAMVRRNIWTHAVEATRSDSTENTAQVVLPAISDMITVTTARTLALRTRTPTLILVALCLVAAISAWITGYSVSRGPRSVAHMLAYAACVSLTVYTVLDLDNPREGMIHLNAAEQLLKDLHSSIAK